MSDPKCKSSNSCLSQENKRLVLTLIPITNAVIHADLIHSFFCLILTFQITGFLEPVAMYGEPVMKIFIQFYELARELARKPKGKTDSF